MPLSNLFPFHSFMSLYQKDANGTRTDEEHASFKRGLDVMASVYASLTGTAVLLQRVVPETPTIGELAAVWNGTQYERRGWTSFEQGVAQVAEAHVAKALAQLERQQRSAPDAMRRALDSRPKLIDIGGEPRRAQGDDPLSLLRVTTEAIELARFTNDADRRAVQQLVFGLEWTMHMAVDCVLAQREGSAVLTAKPKRRPPQIQRLPSSHQHLAPGEDRGSDGVQLIKA